MGWSQNLFLYFESTLQKLLALGTFLPGIHPRSSLEEKTSGSLEFKMEFFHKVDRNLDVGKNLPLDVLVNE
jgi:hypothetical protein